MCVLREVKSLEFGCKRLAEISGNFFMSVREPRHERKVLYGCKRPAMLSEKFYMGVTDLRGNPKSSVA